MTWDNFLKIEATKPYFQEIMAFLDQEKDEEGNDNFFPERSLIFQAFNLTPFDKVKVVIIGQDPYHEEHQAHGLAFSVLNQHAPKSLQNIFKELESDCGIKRNNTNLTDWAKQGVLLINATLTVRKHQANSHSKIGWETFTDQAILALNQSSHPIVYILLGNYAQSKVKLIDTNKHQVLMTSHPSFFSCNKGFFGSKIFSKTNDLLVSFHEEPIKW